MNRSALMAVAWLGLGAVTASAGPPLQTPPQARDTRQQEPRQPAARNNQPSATEQRVRAMQPPAPVRGQQPLQVALVTSPGAIASRGPAYYGVPVSVHGQVAAVFNSHSFAVESDVWWPGADNVMVIMPQPAAGATLSQGEFVTVVGTVRPFVRAEVERDYDWFDFDRLPDLNIELEGRPVIVADTARTSSGRMLVQPKQPTTYMFIATPGEIAQTPGRFYGRAVAVRQEIENVWSTRAFTLDEDRWFAGPDLLVFNPNPIFNGRDDFDGYDGEHVTVFGIVRPLVVSEFEQDYDWFDADDYRDLDLGARERRPVLIASSIISDAGFELVRFTPPLALDRAEGALTSRAPRWPDMTARYDRPGPRQGEQAREPQTRTQPSSARQAPDSGPPAASPADTEVRDVSALSGSGAQQMAGRRVQFDRVRVQAVLGGNFYRVGSDTHGVAVRINQPMTPPLAVGDFLQLSGTVLPAPDHQSVSGPIFVDVQQASRTR
jgi:hypothetical protein